MKDISVLYVRYCYQEGLGRRRGVRTPWREEKVKVITEFLVSVESKSMSLTMTQCPRTLLL